MTLLRPAALVTSLLLVACSGESTPGSTPGPAASASAMRLESSAFASGGAIPARHTCDGTDVSVPLAWSGVPASAKTLALVVEDPDAPGETFTHWVLYNLPATTQSLAEHVPTDPTLPSGAQQGRNDFGNVGYGGPCPPSGTHRYYFKLYALDAALTVGGQAMRADLTSAMQGHVVARTELLGTYGH